LQGITAYELVVRQSANSRRLITTPKSDLFFGELRKSVETLKNYIPDLKTKLLSPLALAKL
jgi:hypothetical protein